MSSPSDMSLVVDEERMRPGHWLGLHGLWLMPCVLFSALILKVGWQEGHLARQNPVPLIPKGSCLEQVEMG